MINKQILKFPAAMLLAGVALRVCMNGIISICGWEPQFPRWDCLEFVCC